MSRASRALAAGSVVVAGLVLVLVAGVVLAIGASGQEPDDVATAALTIVREDADVVDVPLLVDELAPSTVMTLRISGFDGNTTGVVMQCVSGERRRCDNRIPVRFDDEGAATIQYLVTDEISEGGCRLGADRCTLEVVAGAAAAIVDTVFVDEAPPLGRITIDTDTGVRPGDVVAVIADGFPANASLTVMVCAWPATSGDRCGSPGPERTVTTDADGRAELTLTLDVDSVGEAGISCARRTACRLVVASEDVGVRARPVTIAFAGPPGVHYDGGRLLIGLVAATALLVLAAAITMTTDWRPPTEADASAIDDAEFADLDAEAAAYGESHPEEVRT